MLSRVLVGLLIFAAGAGGAWYFKSIISVTEVPTATATANRGGGGRAVDVVVANLLHTRKDVVQLVVRGQDAPIVLERAGDRRLEGKLVATLVDRHERRFVVNERELS